MAIDLRHVLLILGTISPALWGSADAQPMRFDRNLTSSIDVSERAEIAEGSATLSPMEYVRFCMTYRSDCVSGEGKIRVTLDDERSRQLEQINDEINSKIVPRRDLAGHIAWSLDAIEGDCNTYAVQKRHALLAEGWPAASLALAVVMTQGGIGHLVLVVRTDYGDIVLDSLKKTIRPWAECHYYWIKIQSSDNSDRWVEVSHDHMQVTAREETVTYE